MAFTIVAHAGQHGLSCRCELHSKAGQRDARVSAASMKPQEETIIMMLSLLLKNASLLMRIMENRHLQYHVLMLDCKSSSLLETSFWMEREKTNHWSLTWDKETLIFDSRFQNWSNYWSESKTCEMNWKWIGPELDYKIGPKLFLKRILLDLTLQLTLLKLDKIPKMDLKLDWKDSQWTFWFYWYNWSAVDLNLTLQFTYP